MEKILSGFNCTKQKYDNSCWIAVANAVLAYMHDKNKDLWNKSITLTEENEQGSAINAIYNQYREILKDDSYFGVEDLRLPTFDDIKTYIDCDDVFVSLLTTETYATPEPDTECNNGHWIALIGYDDSPGSPKVTYYDPGIGRTASFIYGDCVTINGIGMHFANTTRIEIYPDSETRHNYFIS